MYKAHAGPGQLQFLRKEEDEEDEEEEEEEEEEKFLDRIKSNETRIEWFNSRKRAPAAKNTKTWDRLERSIEQLIISSQQSRSIPLNLTFTIKRTDRGKIDNK